jgi:hypothetical protein
MIGDGDAMVEHCEFTEDELWLWVSPDGGPIHCGFNVLELLACSEDLPAIDE